MRNKSHIIDDIKTATPATKNKNQSSSIPKQEIYGFTVKYLKELESLTLTMPLIDSFNPIERLKEIPRTGKAVRIDTINFESIKPRSIYDHIMSMAHLADAFLVLDRHKLIKECDYANLGRLIAYHEIGECLIGDIPAYTDIKGHSPKIENDNRIKNIPKDKRTRIVNDFLWMYANDQQRASIEEMNQNLSNQNTPLMKYFRMLDRIDPVIAVWRYLYYYREELKVNSQKFVSDMSDFFEYPKTADYKKKKYAADFPYLKEILEVLMNSSAAKKYCSGTKIDALISSKRTAKLLKNLIEEVPLFMNN